MHTRNRFSSVVAMAAALLMVFAGTALADYVTNTIDNSIDNTREELAVTAGSTASTTIWVQNQNRSDGDTVNSCNLAGGGNYIILDVSSSDTLVATVSPAQIRVDGCDEGNGKSVTVTGVAAGTANINFAKNATSTAPGEFVLDTANFTAKVSAAPVTNRAPEVATAALDASGNEGDTLQTSGAFSDPDVGDTLTITKQSGAGTVTPGTNGSWSWSLPTTDNDSGTVVVRATDSKGAYVEDSFNWSAANVAPTATLDRVGPANVFAGATVTYNARATDLSSMDTTAGFTWSFNNGTFGSSASLQQTYATCGAKTESVRAQDKDGGISDPATAGVSVFDGGFHGAIKPAMRNQVQAGRALPVQIRVGCGEVPETGLRPAIQLIKGDQDPETEPSADAQMVTASVSSADTNGVMRASDGGYIYNLQIPSTAKANDLFTIRVRSWGSDGPLLQALVQIRK